MPFETSVLPNPGLCALGASVVKHELPVVGRALRRAADRVRTNYARVF
jgi:hypothetical protein